MIQIISSRGGLNKILTPNDFVLVDTSLFDRGKDLTERLYEIKKLRNLDSVEEELERAHLVWQGLNKSLLRRENVYTIPLVLEELKDMQRIVQTAYNFYSRALKSIRLTCNGTERAGKAREERRIARKEKLDPCRTPLALAYLNCLGKDICRTTKYINIYSGSILNFPHLVERASETDYCLMGAAFGYSQQNPDKEVKILSKDRHLFQILQMYSPSQENLLLDSTSI